MPFDRPRYLDKRPGRSYTEDFALALPYEGEAVPEAYQAELTAHAHRTQHATQVAEWEQRKTALVRELAWLETQRFQRDVSSSVRAVRRQLDRIDKRIIGA